MILDMIYLFLITLIPALELRASIPFGSIQQEHSLWLVVPVCVVANILLGIVWFLCISWGERQLERLPFFHRLWMKFCQRAQNKIKPKVDKYGTLGVAVFIGVPLPGSGVYTGGLGAYLLGMRFRQFIIANVIGVLIAGAAVTGVVAAGPGTFGWFYGLFVKPPAETVDTFDSEPATPQQQDDVIDPADAPEQEDNHVEPTGTQDTSGYRPTGYRGGRAGQARAGLSLRRRRADGTPGLLCNGQDKRAIAGVSG